MFGDFPLKIRYSFLPEMSLGLSEKQHVSSETCEADPDGVSELMDLLRMDLDPDGEQRKAEGGEAPCSVSRTDEEHLSKNPQVDI